LENIGNRFETSTLGTNLIGLTGVVLVSRAAVVNHGLNSKRLVIVKALDRFRVRLDKGFDSFPIAGKAVSAKHVVSGNVDVFIIGNHAQNAEAGCLQAKIGGRRNQSRVDLSALEGGGSSSGIDARRYPLNIFRAEPELVQKANGKVIWRIAHAADA